MPINPEYVQMYFIAVQAEPGSQLKLKSFNPWTDQRLPQWIIDMSLGPTVLPSVVDKIKKRVLFSNLSLAIDKSSIKEKTPYLVSFGNLRSHGCIHLLTQSSMAT